MTLVGLTQRVSVVEEYGERRDCLDQRWASLVRSHGGIPVPLFNAPGTAERIIDRLSLDRIILTGGGDIPGYGSDETPRRDRFEREVIDIAVNRELPVLGVCRGFQRLNQFFGGELTRIEGHVGNLHPITIEGSELFNDSSNCRVNSYHHFAIENETLADPLCPLGRVPDGTVEYAAHHSLPVAGIMWHPEREHPDESPIDLIVADFITGSDQ